MNKAMITGKQVLLTGGGSGIGRAISIRLAELGANVAVTDLNAQTAAETAAMLDTSMGQKHTSFSMDVTSRPSVDQTVADVVKACGKIDILINNAGVSSMNRIENLTEKEWDFNFNVNIKGMFFVTQAVLPELKKTEGHDCQHRFDGIDQGCAPAGALHRFQVCGSRLYQDLCAGVCGVWHQRQLCLPRLCQDLDAGARGGLGRQSARHDPAGSH